MTKKAWIIFAAMCVGLIGGLIFLQQRNQIDVSSVDTTKAQPASSESGDISEHVYGNANSKVLLVEYADFQCPGCNSSYPVTKKVIEKYKDKIGFIFRNYPLTSAHPNALAAAAAAESRLISKIQISVKKLITTWRSAKRTALAARRLCTLTAKMSAAKKSLTVS